MPWLIMPPEDFRAQLKACAQAGEASGWMRLAMAGMDFDQLSRFARVAEPHAEAIVRATGCPRVTIGMIGTHTLDYLADAIRATGLRHGLVPVVDVAPYGQTVQAVLDRAGPFVQARPDFIHVVLDARALGLDRAVFHSEAATTAVNDALAHVAQLCSAIRGNLGSVPVVETLPATGLPLFGSFDARFPGSSTAMIAAYNAGLADAAGEGALIVDVAYAAMQAGLDRWHDPRGWHKAKIGCSTDVLPLYADFVCRTLAAARGRTRRCLVLDLDNTLWGGVIGDDGLHGIEVGQGSATGEAHAAIQTLARELRSRGVILAVCSKNDEAIARSAFLGREGMVLNDDDIAVFVANWTDKATNLRQIARTLNIGTDALAFLDDNPAERAIVRAEMPEVAVIEVGSDPSEYCERVARSGFFEAIAYSDEDAARADFYRANAARQQVAPDAANDSDSDIDAWLASLQMRVNIRPFDAAGRARIVQLVAKSNQFNLTTKRYSADDIARIEADPARYARQVRLEDKFGDNGMISVVIFDRRGDVWDCDTWLMSCRVIGRRVEEAVLADVAAAARAAGAIALTGRYVPTARNGLVAQHFEKLGFVQKGVGPDGTTLWRLDLETFENPVLPIGVEKMAGTAA